MRYVIDSDVAIEYLRGNPRVVENLRSIDRLAITQITLAELFYGIYKSQNIKKHEEKLRDFLSGMRVLGLDALSCRTFGRLKAGLTDKGRDIDDFDLMIAAICLSTENTLITGNLKHFQNVEGLTIKSM